MQRTRNVIRIAVALSMLAALFVVGGSPALANHGTNTIEVDPEVTGATSGETVTLTAQYSTALIVGLGGPNIDFEIELGPGDADGNTPRTPDMTCNIGPLIFTTCSVSYSSSGRGTDVIRAWIDHDGDDGTVEYDNDEAPNEGVHPGAAEPDITDVVIVNWSLGAPAKLDCDDASFNDEEKNVSSGAGSNETYTCKVTDGGNVPMEGVQIDGENLSSVGINDPERPGADYNNFCTTAANGICQGVIPATGSVGTAEFCFWTDGDANDVYDPLAENASGGPQHNDGGDCDAEAFNEAENNDPTDVVQLTWERETNPPISRITRPADGGTYLQNSLLQFQGTAQDNIQGAANITKVQIALRKYRTDKRCGNWTGSAFKISPCSERIWVDATLGTATEGVWSWSYDLPRSLARSTGSGAAVRFYAILARATDSNGNVEVLIVDGRNRNFFEVT